MYGPDWPRLSSINGSGLPWRFGACPEAARCVAQRYLSSPWLFALVAAGSASRPVGTTAADRGRTAAKQVAGPQQSPKPTTQVGTRPLRLLGSRLWAQRGAIGTGRSLFVLDTPRSGAPKALRGGRLGLLTRGSHLANRVAWKLGVPALQFGCPHGSAHEGTAALLRSGCAWNSCTDAASWTGLLWRRSPGRPACDIDGLALERLVPRFPFR